MTDREREVREYCAGAGHAEGVALALALLALLDVDKGRKFEARTAVILGKHLERMVDAAHAALFHSGAKDEND